ncbi:MAG: threonine--tRNA ligase [Candidatus Moranbacteria bacterium]|nr:threonine--tRNA ligase [Candidatus Moranbacteria bacterium]
MSEKKQEIDKQAIIRHSTAHILANAVLEMFPEAKIAVGPATEDGFYHDFELPRTLIPEDLEILENKMREIIKANNPFEKSSLSIEKAIEKYEKLGQKYKVELIKDLEKDGTEKVSIYKSGNYVDLCTGPHLDSTGEINYKAFKLTKFSGAYWKGDEKREQLQRIYGVVFNDRKKLKQYLFQQEEAKKRDHRKLGKELDLFTIDPNVGLGLPLYKPNGAMIFNLLKRWFEDEQLKRNYLPVITPHIGRKSLWETSGHWGFYNESMYPPLELGQTLEDYQDSRKPNENETYLLKPMNCPFHVSIFNDNKHSYRDLPIKYYEFGTVYRFEQKGELSGLTRVRGFTQDDAHIICTKEQLEEEMKKMIDFAFYILQETFGFEIEIYASFRDSKKEKYLGDNEKWEVAEETIIKILADKKIKYKKEIGEAAFYGPKMDFKVKDSLGRQWQLSTIQFDFNLPERFDMSFVNNKGEKEQPYMIHRALFGSVDRFMGILIEHFAGAFPIWLSPMQVVIIPVSEKFNDYANEVKESLSVKNIRAKLNIKNDSLGKRIREAEKQEVPYILVVGEKEMNDKTVAVRARDNKENKQEVVKFDDFVVNILEEVLERK